MLGLYYKDLWDLGAPVPSNLKVYYPYLLNKYK